MDPTKGDNRKAFELYQASIRVDPGYQAAYYNLANLLAGEGNQKWAFETGGGVVSSPVRTPIPARRLL